MQYIIEDNVVFRSDDGALWQINNKDEKIILTPIVARLLHFLLLEQGKILTRKEIMKQVWEAHGLEPSNNSLNQYISQLRKIFHLFDLPENVIKTLPRIGFTFSDEFEVRVKEISSTDILNNSFSSSEKIKNKSPFIWFLKVITFFSIVTISIPFIIGKATEQIYYNNKLAIKPILIGHEENCSIYSVRMGVSSTLPEALSIARRFIKKSRISCTEDNVVYFYAQNSIIHDQYGRVFLSVCKKDGGTFLSCKNNFFNSWL